MSAIEDGQGVIGLHMLMVMATAIGLTAITAHTPIMAHPMAIMVVDMPMAGLMAITVAASTVAPESAWALPSKALPAPLFRFGTGEHIKKFAPYSVRNFTVQGSPGRQLPKCAGASP
jgi:hypothetical protein